MTSQLSTVTNNTVVSSDGATIHYLTMGHGPSVIVIPGAFAMAADYTPFGISLAEQFTVHIIERRGHGLSSPQGAEYGIDKECADVLALQQQTGATLLVGHSFGGFVALEVARNNSGLTNMAVYEPGVSIEGSIPTGWMRRYQQQLDRKDSMGAFVEFMRAMGPSYTRILPRWYLKLLLPLVMNPDERQRRLSLLQEGLREVQEQARLDSTYGHYQEISAPVLLMYGGKTSLPGVHLVMKRLAAVIPYTETQVFPKLDHFGIDQKAPQDIARAVSAFFLKER